MSWDNPVRLAALSYTYSHPQPDLGPLSVPSKTHSLCMYPLHRHTQSFPTGKRRALFLEHLLYARHCLGTFTFGAILYIPEVDIDEPILEMKKT